MISISINKLRAKRKERKLTQQELAEAIGISGCHYCQLEKGLRRMPLPFAKKIAITLDASLDELFMQTTKPGKR
ncbi:MAG: helix-turn-helix transcriptional regulator [Peptococcaceae bacterium]|nr:helix-turn-helix transcriptional regulator [Candidatus Syntrophopropionicum ammoniitolerans]